MSSKLDRVLEPAQGFSGDYNATIEARHLGESPRPGQITQQSLIALLIRGSMMAQGS
jgi:hypothetical protein